MDKPAFPKTEWAIDAYGAPVINESGNGLTRRELFAAMAMQGLCANHGAFKAFAQHETRTMQDLLAEAAVQAADELIAALDAEQSK